MKHIVEIGVVVAPIILGLGVWIATFSNFGWALIIPATFWTGIFSIAKIGENP